MKRRDLLKKSAAGLVAAGAAGQAMAEEPFRIQNQRIRQSVMGWCFKPLPVEELIEHCQDIGIPAIEGIPFEDMKLAVKKGMEISLVSSHRFNEGPCDPKNHEKVLAELRTAIARARELGAERVITFSGYRVEGLSAEEMKANCLKTWREILPEAEKAGVTLCFEHLSTRDDSHPMKGHPGYFADDVDLCFELVREMDSPHFKLLYDFYHVSVMNGDLTRRLRENFDLIGHLHTAGNPGRGEIDDTQEINYPPLMREVVKLGYEGYVAQEFIPTWEDPIAALRDACRRCDV